MHAGDAMAKPVRNRKKLRRGAAGLGVWLLACRLAQGAGNVTAIWANDGGDKVARAELRAAGPEPVTNSVWDGAGIRLAAARNEVIGFNVVLEAAGASAGGVSVALPALRGPGGFELVSAPAAGAGLFAWTNRNVELFLVRYLEIKGLSRLSYETYDERHVPERMRRPWWGAGYGEGGWTNRPDHDQEYPEIAVPLELAPEFAIAAGQNQSIWVDVYVPQDAPAGAYTGCLTVAESGAATSAVPVALQVRNFALPDQPAAKTMVYLGYSDVNRRYLDDAWPEAGTSNAELSVRIRDRHFQLAHRHKISLVDDNPGAESWPHDRPRPDWEPRLDGSLFTAAQGYAGPGAGTGNAVFSIGTYGSWSWRDEGETGMWAHADAWAGWFASNAPAAERFLYLIDESDDYAQTETWAQWLAGSPGPGSNLAAFATLPLPAAVSNVPGLDVAASWFTVGDSNQWAGAAASHRAAGADRRFYLYNGKRPANGSFATEDDGVALRELAWVQYKMRIDRWFFWESTYYNNFQGGMGETRVFQSAFTFGARSETNEVLGETGWNYSNGDGVLFYPGTDRVFPEDSYEVPGPFASLRLKQWRRGIQDVDYLALAATFAPARVAQIVADMVPRALWEYGVADPDDPTWVRTDVSWSADPDRWEAARRELGDLIEAALANQVLGLTAAPAEAAQLTWPLLGPDYRYTVEFTTALDGGTWVPAPGSWPSAATNWTIVPAEPAGLRFFRVKAAP